MTRHVLWVGLLLLGFSSLLLARPAREQQRIDYLIQSLGSLPNAVFIRNGNEYSAADARSHLEKKLKYAGNRIQTAEEFVKHCASQSSISHRPYQIRFEGGKVTDTSSYFREKLKEFDQKHP